MKKLVAVLAVLSFVPAVHAADFTWGGSHRVQYSDTNNYDFTDDAADATSGINQRTRINADVKAGEKMNAHVGLVHNAMWGENPDQTPALAAATTENQVSFNEAYFGWMMSDSMTFKAGRQGATIAGGEVVSTNDWEAVHNAFDGAILSYDHEFAKISGFGVRAIDAGNDDLGRFWGVNFDFKGLPEWLKSANLHYIIVKIDEDALGAGSDSEDSTRLGFSFAGATGAFNYRAAYAMHDGEVEDTGTGTADIKASMMEAEFGYTNADMRNLHVGFVYHTDSGDEDTSDTDYETYDAFFYEKHANAGLMDILGWGNLTYMQVKLGADISDDLRLAADYYMFTATEKGTAANSPEYFGANGYSAVQNTAGTDLADGEDDLGTELDITLTKKYSNNFSIAASYRMFEAGDAIDSDADGATQYYLEGNLTF